MKFDKFFNSKIFAIFELIYRIIILNLLTILTIVLGLVIFSIIPAFIALSITIKSLNSDTDFPLIKSYYLSFFSNYKKGLKLSIFYLILLILCVVNTYYLYCAVNDWGSSIWMILYTIMLVIDCFVLLAIINLGFVCCYFPSLSYFKTIKYSFVLLFVEMWKNLIILIILLGSIYLIALFPYIFPFIVIGVIFYFTNQLIKVDYERIRPREVKSLDVFMYINKQVDDKIV